MARTKKKSGLDADPKARALAVIREQFGNESIMDLSGPVEPIDVISSGSIVLDRALGVEGYPRGRLVEVFGPESSGKTTLALHAAAEAQRLGLLVGFVDAEHAIDVGYAEALGVDLGSIHISQPDHGEQAMNIVESMCRTGAYGLVVVDSVAALTPKAELDGEMGDSHVGLQARLMSQAMRKLAGAARSSHTTVFFINQLRMKIGVTWGSPETTSGGTALRYYASQRLDVRRIGGVKDSRSGDDTQFVGNRTRVKVKKNKVAPPFKECEFDITYGVGIDKVAELIEVGVEKKVIDKAGAWLAFEGERFQGRHALAEAIRGNDGLLGRVDAAVRGSLP